MTLRTYTTVPRAGRPRRIWLAFSRAGLPLRELHYNPNNWGQNKEGGWGTWACTLETGEEIFCGEEGGIVYSQMPRAPYRRVEVGPSRPDGAGGGR